MSDLPPDWALEKAKNLRASEILIADKRNGFELMYHAFARYIAEHEEAPVDPLLIEAREIAQSLNLHMPMAFASGDYDKCGEMLAAMKALRRGIELGKAMS